MSNEYKKTKMEWHREVGDEGYTKIETKKTSEDMLCDLNVEILCIKDSLNQNREEIENRETMKYGVTMELLDGKPLVSKEVKDVFFVEAPSALMSKIVLANELRLDVPILKLNKAGQLEVDKIVDLDSGSKEKILIQGIPDSFFIIKDKTCNIDLVNAAINDRINSILDDKVIEILGATTTSITAQSVALGLVEGISKLSKSNKKNMTLMVSPEEYVKNVQVLGMINVEGLSILLVPGIESAYVGNLNKVILNYVIDKCEIGKDDIHKGTKVAACNLWNAGGAIMEDGAIVKMVIG